MTLPPLLEKMLRRFEMLFKSMPVDWTVIPGVKKIQVYTDPEFTQPTVPPIHFGEIRQGESKDFEMYVVNEGAIPTAVVIDVVGDPGAASVTVTPVTFSLAAGESQMITLVVLAAPTSPLEAGAVTVEIGDGESS